MINNICALAPLANCFNIPCAWSANKCLIGMSSKIRNSFKALLYIWMWPCSLETQWWHLVNNWTLGLMNTLKLMWNQLIISSYFKVYGVQKFHLQEACLCPRDWFCILPRMKNWWHCFISKVSCHVTLRIKKTSTCGSQVGHTRVTFRLFWGSNGSTSETHFQPWQLHSYRYRVNMLLQATKYV